MQTNPSEPYALKYYRQLSVYLNGGGTDPGNFGTVRPDRPLTSFTVALTPSVPDAYHGLLSRLAAIRADHDELIDNIIVHGSYGDFTITPYSDLDLVVCLSQRAVENPRHRRTLRALFRTLLLPLIHSVDPLQHHGAFLLWPTLADAYVQSILPAVAYTRAWSVKPLNLRLNISSHPGPPKLNGLLQTITAEKRRCLNARSLFFTKRFLSHIMMVPCLYFGDRGRYLHKADSFSPFVSRFPDTQSLFGTLSDIRHRWPVRPAIVQLIARHSAAHRLLGKYFAPLCGLFYRRVGIDRPLQTLNIAALLDPAGHDAF